MRGCDLGEMASGCDRLSAIQKSISRYTAKRSAERSLDYNNYDI